jgi:hypothetical protein
MSVAGAEEAQFVPAARASVCAQSGDVGGSDHGEIEILSEVMGDAVSAVEPGGAHGASLRLLLSEHEVINDERAIGIGEEFTEAHGAHGRITCIEVARALFKLVVLKRGALRKMAAQLGDAFLLMHQLDFGKAKLLALGKVFGRFVGQIGLAKRSIDDCVDHDDRLQPSFSLRQERSAIAHTLNCGLALVGQAARWEGGGRGSETRKGWSRRGCRRIRWLAIEPRPYRGLPA